LTGHAQHLGLPQANVGMHLARELMSLPAHGVQAARKRSTTGAEVDRLRTAPRFAAGKRQHAPCARGLMSDSAG
jgi:hypothetical protein